MMSFFPTTTSISMKPHIRQEGFVPDDLFTSNHAKYPSPALNLPSMDFGDELAGLMAADTNGNRSPPNGYHHQQQQHVHQDYYRHNIFDTSVSSSNSRPPVVADSNTSASSSTTGSIGPTRTTRTRRNGSISGTSPPPLHHGHHHHGHTHSLSHSGALNGGLNSMGSIGMSGFAMGMNSLDGSMGMMGMGALGPLQSPTLQTSSLSTNNNNNNSTLSSSLPSPTGPLPSSVGSSSPSHSASTITANHQDKQSILASEKRRRRRESHNAVERRRRDNINEKISELATLIPECMLEGGISSGVHGSGGSSPSHITPTSPCAGGIELLDTSYDLTNAHGNGSSSPISGIKDENRGLDEGGGVIKANKGMILRKSVDYIRYLQQLVTAQGARNRELEQQLRAYRGSSTGGDSASSLSDGGQEDVDDILMFQDGNTGVVEFGSYAAERRGRLPSMPEGDDEVDDHHQHRHHHHHHQQQQQHQHHLQQQRHHRENMVEVDMSINMGMMGMNTTMNGGGGHFNGMDNNHAAAPDNLLRGRARDMRRPNDVGTDESLHLRIGGALKEEMGDDDDDVHVVGGFGIGVGRTTRAI